MDFFPLCAGRLLCPSIPGPSPRQAPGPTPRSAVRLDLTFWVEFNTSISQDGFIHSAGQFGAQTAETPGCVFRSRAATCRHLVRRENDRGPALSTCITEGDQEPRSPADAAKAAANRFPSGRGLEGRRGQRRRALERQPPCDVKSADSRRGFRPVPVPRLSGREST